MDKFLIGKKEVKIQL